MIQGNTNFLGLTDQLAQFETSNFVVLPVSYDGTASYLKGTAAAPQAIIEASAQLELFDEDLNFEYHRCGIYTHDDIGSNQLAPQDLQKVIYDTAKKLSAADKTILSLGGEHSITSSLVKAANEKYENISVLQIDAHADLRDEYEGTKFSHACVMKRIFDMGINFASVGIRSYDKPQYDFMQANAIVPFTPRYINSHKNWIDDVLAKLTDNVYLTVDIDGLDCSVAPGTGTPEPGGLTYLQLIDLISTLAKHKKIIGADIVEVIPGIAGAVTEFTAARIASKIIANTYANNR